MTSPLFVVVLPALNEETALRRLIPDLVSVLQSMPGRFQIIVVDDGSGDGTKAMIEALPADWNARALRHDVNRGYGASLATGFLWALDGVSDGDLIACMDSDNTHAPEYLTELARKIDVGYDVVTASYRCAGGRAYGIPFQRRLFSDIVNRLLAIVFPLRSIQTYTNGYRVYRAGALRKLFERYKTLEEPGFAGGTELFLKACACGAKPAEIPFDFHYEERGKDSKINIPKTVGGYLRLLGQAVRLKVSSGSGKIPLP